VLSGDVGVRVGGRQRVATPGAVLAVPAGAVHDWWNAGDDYAHVLVEVAPGERFEEMIVTFWGLANARPTNSNGMPGLLQLALSGREFSDTVTFTNPPRDIQRLLFALLAPLARWRGLRGSYPELRETVAAPDAHLELAGARRRPSLVGQGGQRVQPGRPPRGRDRGEDPRDDRDHHEGDQRADEPTGRANCSPCPLSAAVTRAARNRPTAIPRAAPSSAVTTLSWRIIRRTWRRVIPTAPSVPSSRVRSNTDSASMLTMPNRLTITASASST
jgi:hypothetical protein